MSVSRRQNGGREPRGEEGGEGEMENCMRILYVVVHLILQKNPLKSVLFPRRRRENQDNRDTRDFVSEYSLLEKLGFEHRTILSKSP